MSFWEILSVATWFCNNIVAQKEEERQQEANVIADAVVEIDKYSWQWWLFGGCVGTLLVLAAVSYAFQEVILQRVLQYAESRRLDVVASRQPSAAESSKRSARRASDASTEVSPHLRSLLDRCGSIMAGNSSAGTTPDGRPMTEQEAFYEEFLRDLGQAMSKDVFDVSLVGTDGVPVGAIRSILAARSPVLKRMLYGEFSEASSEAVCLGFHSTVLKALVEYCQSGSVQHITAVFVSSSSQEEEKVKGKAGGDAEKVLWKLDVPSSFSSSIDMISTWVGVIQAASYLEMDNLTRYVSAEVVRALHHDNYLACVVYGATVRLGMVQSLVREAALTFLRTCAPEQLLLQNQDVVATLDFAGLRDIVMDPFIPMEELTKFQFVELWSRSTASDEEDDEEDDIAEDAAASGAPHGKGRKTRNEQAMEFLKTGVLQLERISAADLDTHVAPSGLVDTNTMLKAFKSRALYVENSRDPSNSSSRGLFALLGGDRGSEKVLEDEKESKDASTEASAAKTAKTLCLSPFEQSHYAHVVGSSLHFVNGTYTLGNIDPGSSHLRTYTKVVTRDGYEWTLELSLQPRSFGMMASLLSWQQEDKKKPCKEEQEGMLVMKRPLFSPADSATATTRCTCCGGECRKAASNNLAKQSFLQHKLYRTQPQKDGGDARTQLWIPLMANAGTAPVVVWTDAKVEPCFGMVPSEEAEESEE